MLFIVFKNIKLSVFGFWHCFWGICAKILWDNEEFQFELIILFFFFFRSNIMKILRRQRGEASLPLWMTLWWSGRGRTPRLWAMLPIKGSSLMLWRWIGDLGSLWVSMWSSHGYAGQKTMPTFIRPDRFGEIPNRSQVDCPGIMLKGTQGFQYCWYLLFPRVPV